MLVGFGCESTDLCFSPLLLLMVFAEVESDVWLRPVQKDRHGALEEPSITCCVETLPTLKTSPEKYVRGLNRATL